MGGYGEFLLEIEGSQEWGFDFVMWGWEILKIYLHSW